jgi:hypothetical protein
MKYLHVFLFIALFAGTSYAFQSETKNCDSQHVYGKKTCTALIHQIHPTQFVVGYYSIPFKTHDVEASYNDGKLNKYLMKKKAPAIKGPDGKYYILDRHHTFTGIMHSSIPSKLKQFQLHVIKDWSGITIEDFHKRIEKEKLYWPYDENNQKRSAADLPDNLLNLKDDPYRSLAWLVRKNKGFNKLKISYLEFFWAQFFRNQGIQLATSDAAELNKVLPQALKLARSPKASHLPGYKGPQ